MTQKKIIEIEKMQKYIRQFIQERNWESFHNPKNLSMALAIEAAELMEIFQWLDASQSFDLKHIPEILQNVKDELADILSYLVNISDLLDIDLSEAFWNKTKKNEKKYPLSHARKIAKNLSEIGTMPSSSFPNEEAFSKDRDI